MKRDFQYAWELLPEATEARESIRRHCQAGRVVATGLRSMREPATSGPTWRGPQRTRLRQYLMGVMGDRRSPR